MTTTTIPSIPKELATRKAPSIAKWAIDKVQSFRTESHEASDRCPAFNTRTWYFEGRMPRRTANYSDLWEENGKQFRVAVVARGGHYVGQRQVVMVVFEEYESANGEPLPSN